ncbi:hypothetical protein KM043_000725 [Ampulex compressa]|nr:hypothetical protein KM043_000725 [Ampulex compressa]
MVSSPGKYPGFNRRRYFVSLAFVPPVIALVILAAIAAETNARAILPAELPPSMRDIKVASGLTIGLSPTWTPARSSNDSNLRPENEISPDIEEVVVAAKGKTRSVLRLQRTARALPSLSPLRAVRPTPPLPALTPSTITYFLTPPQPRDSGDNSRGRYRAHRRESLGTLIARDSTYDSESYEPEFKTGSPFSAIEFNDSRDSALPVHSCPQSSIMPFSCNARTSARCGSSEGDIDYAVVAGNGRPVILGQKLFPPGTSPLSRKELSQGVSLSSSKMENRGNDLPRNVPDLKRRPLN